MRVEREREREREMERERIKGILKPQRNHQVELKTKYDKSIPGENVCARDYVSNLTLASEVIILTDK